MDTQSMPGKIPLIKNEQGTILVFMTVFVLIFTLLFAGIAEFGRVLILKEQLQTAGDAAALVSATSGANRQVQVEVITNKGKERKSERRCHTRANGKKRCHTRYWCESCGTTTKTVTGRESELIDNRGWKRYCAKPCDCGGDSCRYKIVKRWVTYDEPKILTAAKEIFNANVIDQAMQASVEDVKTFNDSKATNTAPYVIVNAKAKIRSLYPNLRLFGSEPIFPDTYDVRSCSQGDTFYRDASSDKWVKAPPDACWKN